MKVIILSLDKPNKNNRVYPKFVIAKALLEKENQIKNRQIMVTKRVLENANVPLNEVIGYVKDIKIENDNNLVADIEFLDVNNGLDFAPLVESGVVSVTLSGLGSVVKNQDNIGIVQDDYQLLALNLTDDPA